MTLRILLLVVVLAAALVGCGSGDSGTVQKETQQAQPGVRHRK